MTQINSGLVRELDCVESQALVRNVTLHPRGLLKKKELSSHVGTSLRQELRVSSDPACKREKWGPDLLQLRAPHRLIKQGQQELGEAAAPRETSSIAELSHLAGTSCSQAKKEGGRGHNLLPLSGAPDRLIKGSQNKVDYWRWPGENAQSGQCRLHSALRVRAGNWAPPIIL